MSNYAGSLFFGPKSYSEKGIFIFRFLFLVLTLTSLSYQFVAAKQQTGRKEWDQTVITRWSGASSDF